MFRKVILTLIFISCFWFSGEAQTEKYTAPVKWERYKVNDAGVSVLMPKQPVFIRNYSTCSEIDTSTYSAYAQEVVYTLRIISKISVKDWGNCTFKTKFDEQAFEGRLREIRTANGNVEESKYKQNELEVIKFHTKTQASNTIYWIFNDFKNNRWFELWTTYREDAKPETKDFASSIKFAKNVDGTEIETGASQTLGDWQENTSVFSGLSSGNGAGTGAGNGTSAAKNEENKTDAPKENPVQSSDKAESLKLEIVHQPRARYTDAARMNSIQGTVTLKVTFLANGGIGSVTPVSGLPFGLTEQAIMAARKLVFLPYKRNKTTVSVTKTVVYSFSIY